MLLHIPTVLQTETPTQYSRAPKYTSIHTARDPRGLEPEIASSRTNTRAGGSASRRSTERARGKQRGQSTSGPPDEGSGAILYIPFFIYLFPQIASTKKL